ncbi:hypothetical protein HMPREF9370_0335 [Neisseria wadsworthii 9715]|uniref:Uncharacterized protein n=1 Tax=Neisseria wadsworthii 9715 TaxID=1030841 RepID=G4CMM6_9NEIS|nr:hypothetical protein HMPREF9370_0335 [Neisseria wadsworthii 9715]
MPASRITDFPPIILLNRLNPLTADLKPTDYGDSDNPLRPH